MPSTNLRQRGAPSRPDLSQLPTWLARVYALPALFDLLQSFARVSVSIGPLLPNSYWHLIYMHPASFRLLRLELLQGRADERVAYNMQNSRAARETKSTQLTSLFGLWDFTTPILHQGEAQALIHAGPFLRRGLTSPDIEDMWREFTRRSRPRLDREFFDYARWLLELPVLEDDKGLPKAYARALELSAEALTSVGDPHRQLEEVRRLREERFAKRAERYLDRGSQFIDPVLGSQWEDGWISMAERAELGIDAVPNAVIAFVLDEGSLPSGYLEAQVRLERLRRAVAELARARGQMLAAPLGDVGVCLLVATDPKLDRTRRRMRLRRLAEQARVQLRAEIGVDCPTGVAELASSAVELPKLATRARIAALQSARLGVPITFAAEAASVAAEPSSVAILLRLVDRVGKAQFDAAKDDIAVFIAAALAQTEARAEPLRVHVEHALWAILDALERHYGLTPMSVTAMRLEFMGELRQAASSQAIVRVYEEWANELLSVAQNPGDVDVELKLRRARNLIDELCTTDLSLGSVARRVGLSKSYLSRLFRPKFGVGFGEYLLQRRIERAKAFLKTTELSITAIASECSFDSASHFHRAFRKNTGLTPGAFRKRP